jgi:hypothetical protein
VIEEIVKLSRSVVRIARLFFMVLVRAFAS